MNDHLGNVRAVIGPPRTDIFTATMESEVATTEDAQFKNIAPRVAWVNGTVTPPAPAGNEAVRLSNTRPVGPGISLKVSPGDVITAEVYAYYEGCTDCNNTLPLNTIVNAVAAAFGGVSGAPGDPGKVFDGLSGTLNGGFAGAAGSGSNSIPAAYLNMITFNNNLEVPDPLELPMSAIPITGSANMQKQKLTIGPITIPSPGYVYIYVNNNSNSATQVYFDDLKVTQVHSPFVAGADYYPFGLTMSDREITTEPYRFGYQGQYAEEENETGWNSFDLRMYDARFGRWVSPDPYGQYATPYEAMGNSPNSRVDVDGGFDNVYAFTSGKEATRIVETADKFDRVFIDFQYAGLQNKGWGKALFSDAKIFGNYNSFYSSFGKTLLNNDFYSLLNKSARITGSKSSLMRARVTNRDSKILYATLAVPALAMGGGELIASAPAISSAVSAGYTETSALVNEASIYAKVYGDAYLNSVKRYAMEKLTPTLSFAVTKKYLEVVNGSGFLKSVHRGIRKFYKKEHDFLTPKNIEKGVKKVIGELD